MADDDYWFAPKRFGFGTGLPISWQGWVATALMIGIALALVTAFRGRPVQLIAALIPVSLVYIIICARKTRGGWRWRWGGKE